MATCSENGCSVPRGSACHCPACHQTFGSLGLFDSHQQTNYRRRPAVRCKSPETLGLVLDVWGTWRTTEDLLATTKRVSAMNTSKYERRKLGSND